MHPAHGTDPRVSPATVPALPSPAAATSDAVRDLFNLTKRKASVVVVLDISGSMNGESIRSATEATAQFLSRLDPKDEVAVLLFNDGVFTLSEPEEAGNSIEELQPRVRGLIAHGGTALCAAVCKATELTAKLRAEDVAAREACLYGIILFSDGEDTQGKPSENQMFATCLPANAEADGFKIFPIAFGRSADKEILEGIAAVTGGQVCEADPSSIQDCYLAISAEQ